MNATRYPTIDYRESPTAWFCVLERARRENNFVLAARAQRELKRLGVKVAYALGAPRSRD